VKVPPMTGRVAMVIDSYASLFMEPDLSCDGFARCSASVANVVGPIFLTVQP
jgi:hypothetical protein